MPRSPHFAPETNAMQSAVFSPTAKRVGDIPEDVCPLHVGDTWMEPFEGGRMEDLREVDYPGLHRYCEARGVPALVDAIVEKVRARNGLPCERASVLVTAGATGALGAAVGAIASPGDEVLILAPYWPLIPGVVAALRATPVEIPFYDRVASADDALAAVREALGPRSVALYVSSPSNPTGRVLPEAWLAALADWAARENLWLISDEVYEDYVYRGAHVSLARFAPERTVTVFSFSKSFGMAGNRTGYLVAPPDVTAQALKISTHTAYSAPTAGQIAARRALRDGRGWIARARQSYQQVGDATAELLGLPPPEGSMFHFIDVREKLDARGIWGFLEDCVTDGVALAPGPSCGAAYEGWVRLCYTSVPPERALEAVRRVARRLA
ncbi:MAG: pyridoxal phosphate-dependent aminotransferase [Myxococcales bacterium]|nr:pyridoxal phosphate-dependent aminotransferase [Myxococcales bacterium]MDH5307224.1 pyridoxal phosphate-dependent aminotransferase [Myxococcales bacterium]MDH5565059.1 pyridoxal phosphate-dependent aminotransferase [Myxococcales bacterium]